MDPIRVALADDHPIVLAGITSLLRDSKDIEIVGQASTGPSALELAVRTYPDVAVVDLSLPGLGGVEFIACLVKRCPEVRVLVLTVHEDRAYVEPVLQAGACGYLLKRSAPDDLPRAIRAVARGGIFLDPEIAAAALSSSTAAPAAVAGAQDRAALSPREELVIKLTSRGLSNKEIARELQVSVKTVETYKGRAAEKLNLRSRTDIVRYGISRGWFAAAELP